MHLLRVFCAALMGLPAVTFAQAAQAPGAPSFIGQMVMLGGFIVIFYFLLWRPQAKRAKEHKELIENLEKGHEVATTGGMVGKVTKVSGDFVVVSVSENVELKFQRQAISAVLPKGTLKAI